MKGIFITTSNFTREALEYTPRNETKIVLIDGEQLAQLMIDHNLGCTTQQIYVLKKIASDYFGENQKLKSPVTLTLQGFFLKNTFVTKPAFLLLIANCGFDYAQPPLCTN